MKMKIFLPKYHVYYTDLLKFHYVNLTVNTYSGKDKMALQMKEGGIGK